jgi:hypothetical protein
MSAVAVLLVVVAPARAAVTVNETDFFAASFLVPCAAGGAGEIVDISGPLHVLMSFTINGNNLSGMFHFQPQGITGIGETAGDKYQAVGVTAQTFKVSLQNGQANQTFINNFGLIGQGSASNFLVHENMHVTVNANGTVTVVHDNFLVECK